MLSYNATVKLWGLLTYPSFHLQLFHCLSNEQQNTKYNEDLRFMLKVAKLNGDSEGTTYVQKGDIFFFSKMSGFAFERYSSPVY